MKIWIVNRVLILLTISCLFGCATLHNSTKPDLRQLTSENVKELSGVYENVPKHDSTYSYEDLLWNQIKYRDYDYAGKKGEIESEVRIEVINDKEISFELFQGGNMVKHKIIKGRI